MMATGRTLRRFMKYTQ